MINSRKVLECMESTRRILLEPASEGFNGNPGQKAADTPYIGESSFNTNMLVILAALLCALICAMGLNSIVRCAFRCTRLQAALFASTEDAEATRVVSTGMKWKALRALPRAVYGAAGSKLPSTDCPICLAEFVVGEEMRILPNCNHGFHMHCIDTWLASHSSCPTCRQNLLELSGGYGKNNTEGNMDMDVTRSARPGPLPMEAIHNIQV